MQRQKESPWCAVLEEGEMLIRPKGSCVHSRGSSLWPPGREDDLLTRLSTLHADKEDSQSPVMSWYYAVYSQRP